MADLSGDLVPDLTLDYEGYIPPHVNYDAELADLFVRDSSAPVISNVIPTPGSTIPKYGPWQFDVTDDLGLAGVIVKVRFAGRPTETVFDVDAFEGFYSASSVSVIANGFRFVIRRTGGWPAPPTFFARAIDMQGNQNA